MPRVSVVVPIFNVEPYLDECLASLEQQTFTDLEIVMVDDGSTDGSAAIAERFAARDGRFRLLRQPNGGLGRARNTGADAARGEFLAFVDSDDKVALHCYELLLRSLEETGSDFATGNVHRFNRFGSRQAPFLAKVFARTRQRTHVKQFRALVVDRIAPNKLWRRSFWDEHRMRFPEGVVHEDIPVVVPAQFQAKHVDVIADPVYFYRVREGEDRSITQRRRELPMLLDRLAAIEHVDAFLAEHEGRDARRWYAESVVADDLRYHLNVLDGADEEYRRVFLDRVNAFLDGVGPHAEDHLPAIERLKYALVRRRRMPELLEVLRFQRERLADTPPVRIGSDWYGDYPYRDDPPLGIPRSVYRLDRELTLSAGLDTMRWRDGGLELGGFAFISGAGAPTPGAQEIAVIAVRTGRFARLRRRIGALRLRVTPGRRTDVVANADVTWSGFTARLEPRRLRFLGRRRPGTWDLFAVVRNGAVKRRWARFAVESTQPIAPIHEVLRGGMLLTAGRAAKGTIAVHVRDRWALLRSHRVVDGEVELVGEVHGAGSAKLALELAARGEAAPRTVDVHVRGGHAFTARIPLAELGAEDGRTWELWLVGRGGVRVRIGLPVDVADGIWPVGAGELVLARTPVGDANLAVRGRRPLLVDARWTDDGELELVAAAAGAAPELVLGVRDQPAEHAFPMRAEGDGRFVARLAPARIATLGGELPLPTGTWEVGVRPDGGRGDVVPVAVAGELRARLPLSTTVDHKPFTFGAPRDDRAILVVERDLDEDERGSFHARRLRETAYAARRGEPLRDAVVYASFGGRACADSPLAIHRELARREAPLEHVWVVHDGMCAAPAGARVLRAGSREHYEALAQARFVVVNDGLPAWFEARPDQVCLQTSQGVPLQRVDGEAGPRDDRWRYVVSPNRFATPLLQRRFGAGGDEMLETGLPRTDALLAPGRDDVRARLRARLGLAEGQRAVLYAPAGRDYLADRRGRQQLDLRLDLERLRRAAGDDAVVLYRKPLEVLDASPFGIDGPVRDVSAYPDPTELLAAADVLVTDYAQAMFDFANTGRPIVLYTYDLQAYESSLQGFSFDLAAKAPGPVLSTGEEVAEAVEQADAVRADFADRYDAFVTEFCELDDGGAAARVVDRAFGDAL